MFHPIDSDHDDLLAVRNGRGGPVTCASCGCRLELVDDAWYHFGRLGGRDARGHLVDCYDSAHGRDGIPAAPLTA